MSAAPGDSTLLAALRTLPAGVYVEAAAAGARPSRLAREFAQAGWQGVQLAAADSGGDIDALLTGAGVVQAHWMAVRGDTAVRMLAHWQANACRPLAVLVEGGPLAASAAPPAWRDTLARNGYLFAVGDDGFQYFVRSDQGVLHTRIAEHASLAWQRRLQESQRALAHAQRTAEKTGSALLMAQAKGMAADARAAMLQQQIDAIYASSSWRSTRLLRWGARLRQDPEAALRELRAAARGRVVAFLRTLAAKAGRNARLRARITALAARHPALARRVEALLRAPAPLPAAMAQSLPPAIDPNNITGQPFKTLLLDELGRGAPPASGQG